MKSARRHRLPKRNARNVMCGYALLRSLDPGVARAAFCDPQYRGLLNAMRYGNEGVTRERARLQLPQMTEKTISGFVEQIERVLSPSGHLFLWCDKYTVGSGGHLRYLVRAPQLSIVDLIAWNKMRPGMGRRARCVTEYIVVLQKQPTRAKGVWIDHRLLDSWTEQSDRSLHPHAKPYQLTERLIRAVTKRGDLIVDPAAGSYTVLEACIASGREFIGCDLAPPARGEGMTNGHLHA
jgi:site-specific DNA-methyltransferase (adenine-specific)